ncbi:MULTISPECIES: hypothetical protein [Ralstonia solanacearum species complex]|uniref:hypothetical protein n=1 Tax=Ralstonia solanacearum species complex TaxID=3116862 RepID=UPI00078E2349|nr:hypothetical protein [Ralstonia solanacearum]BEU74300.1 hypothetical protein MAFF211271_38550 [Ralstonia pseudosolanacearum]AMP39747.1 hypothetical protein LBM2029_19345 [Ralstonia solanacearum]AXV79177.1 hypothetical protein CJO76_19625 [Ralstonia solanacearum]AXV88587.1 hypothetical protein CJO78_19910 [Ralstonia solanacearum]AXV93198.1 hypothetical protein CJO79_19610 [Ralstonia solanacearum]
MQKKSILALFAAAWSCVAIGATHASTNSPSNGAGPVVAKKSVAGKAGRKAKRKAFARARKGGTQADLDPDAEVLAQVLASDNKNPLWSGRPGQ